jgi:hypothetical protein
MFMQKLNRKKIIIFWNKEKKQKLLRQLFLCLIKLKIITKELSTIEVCQNYSRVKSNSKKVMTRQQYINSKARILANSH